MTVDFIFDILDGEDPGPIPVVARLKMFSEAEGGRSQPFYKNYRPNHNFGDAANRGMYIGQIELQGRDQLGPGEECEAIIRFINGRGLREQLVPGRIWRIQDGMKFVGTAEMIRFAV